MRRIQPIALAALLGLSGAGSAWADHHEGGENAGGQAETRRSDQADENSNAQWDDDAERGRERAEERRESGSGSGEGAEQHERRRHEEREHHGSSGGKGRK